MKDLKNIGKVVGCLIAFLLFFYIYFFRLSPSKEEIEETVLEECVPLQYDFKIISGMTIVTIILRERQKREEL